MAKNTVTTDAIRNELRRFISPSLDNLSNEQQGGNNLPLDKQTPTVEFVVIDCYFPAKMMLRGRLRDSVTMGVVQEEVYAHILVSDYDEVVNRSWLPDGVDRWDGRTGWDSRIPDDTLVGVVEAVKGNPMNGYVFLGYVHMIGEADYSSQEYELEGPQGPIGPTGAKGDKGDKGDEGDPASLEDIIAFVQNSQDNLLYQTNNHIHLNIATGGDYLGNVNGVTTNLATVTLSDEWCFNGKYSFKAEWSSADAKSNMAFFYNPIYRLPVIPGDEITFQINHKSTKAFRQIINWRKEDGTSVSNTIVVIPAAPNGDGVGTANGVAPAEAAYVYFSLYNTVTPVANTVYVDNIRVKKE